MKLTTPHVFNSKHLFGGLLSGASFRDWLDRPGDIALDSNGHPDVVRVCATGAEQPAYETLDDEGRPGGTLIIELCALIREHGGLTSWERLVSLLIPRVDRRNGTRKQRPVVYGPTGRVPFTRGGERLSFTTSLETRVGAWLLNGRLHGVELGDRFAILARDRTIEAQVLEVLEDRARVPAALCEQAPSGTLARLRVRAAPIPVELVDTDGRERLRELLAPSKLLREATPDEIAALRVEAHGSEFVVSGPQGELPAICSRDDILEVLDLRARVQRFIAHHDRGPGLPTGMSWRTTVMRNRAGVSEVMSAGARVREGDRLWFSFENLASDDQGSVFINVVEVGVDGRATVRNRDYGATGLEVPGGQTRELHFRPHAPAGYELHWPARVSREEPRTFELFVVASSRWLDLRSLMGFRLRHPVVLRGEDASTALAWECRRLSFVLEPSC